MYREASGYLFTRHVGVSSHLWLWTVLFFGVGDLLTTSIGLGPGGAVEINPVAVSFGRQFGFAAMVALKLATLGGCFARYPRNVLEPPRSGARVGRQNVTG